jgi:hypothetical protein
VASFENTNSTSISWLSPTFVISLSYDFCYCAMQNKAPVLTVFISMISQRWSLNVRNYSLCHGRREIKTRNNYCLSDICPRLLNTACKRLVRYCQ